MSVWKEDAMLLADIEKVQSPLDIKSVKGSAFEGRFGIARGFDLDNLDHLQTNMVHNLRIFCKENIKYAKTFDAANYWRYELKLDEGEYGWDVLIEKKENLLGLKVTPFTRYEA
jgi:hypothetical protein